jgi:hypothetical protein
MIQLVDQAMEQFLRAAVPLSEHAIDISFDAPDRTWGASITRPTVNLFLWDVKKDGRFAQSGIIESLDESGRVRRRPSGPVVDLRYFVTTWASQANDEHQLLGAVLQCILGHPLLPTEHLPAPLAGRTKIGMRLASTEERKPGDFWSALDGRLKPGLEVELAIPIEAFDWVAAGPPTDAVSIGVRRMAPETGDAAAAAKPPLRRTRQGGRVVMEGVNDGPDAAPVEPAAPAGS